MRIKRFLSGTLSALLALSMVGCSSSGSGTASSETSSQASSAVSSETTEEAKTAQSSVRDTQYGQVQGVDQDGVEVYYGIPYGKEPVGDLRWKAPQDPDKWEDVKDVSTQEEIAMQTTTKDGETIVTGTTDSLNLDVYTTEKAEKLPVLVYVHGGNNQTGSSFEIPGNDMVKTDDCVYVSVNYRLGLLGFNSLPALIDDDNPTGNFAMLDLAKSLQWVKDNIENFGGDPENVTVSGFSAGGRDVMAMLISPTFKDLFSKAIAFSGGMTISTQEQASQKIADTMAPLVVEDKKAKTEEEAAGWLLEDTDEVRDYLYGLDADRVINLFPNAGIRMAKFPHLYVDDIVLPMDGFDGEFVNDVPLMMVTGSEEFSMFGCFDPLLDETKDKEKSVEFVNVYGGDFYRIFNTQLSAQKMDGKYTSNIYLAQINYGDRNSAYPIEGYGSFHGIFVPAISPSQNNYSSVYDFSQAGYTDMAKDFNQYLASFLKDGKPVSADAGVDWTPFTASSPETLVLDAENDKAVVKMEDVTTTNAEIIERMDADPLDAQDKQTIIQNILNGRWFSADLDEYYSNESLW